jgi:hypothetical protein
MAKSIGKRWRLQVDFTPESFQHLSTIMRQRAHARSNKEVARKALRLYDWYLDQIAQGKQLLLVKGDEVKAVELLL